MPNACIGVDVIVGFPGETDELFEETYRFLQELDVAYLHVFTYSERPNTTAVRMTDVVPADVREKRSKMLRILSTKKKRKFYNDHIGSTSTVLFEAEREGDSMFGFTENYLKIEVPFDAALVNKTAKVELLGINSEGNMQARLLQPITVYTNQV
jgi:threonylcarbamoyladenosine tRNA methylthiotransferase MtaB